MAKENELKETPDEKVEFASKADIEAIDESLKPVTAQVGKIVKELDNTAKKEDVEKFNSSLDSLKKEVETLSGVVAAKNGPEAPAREIHHYGDGEEGFAKFLHDVRLMGGKYVKGAEKHFPDRLAQFNSYYEQNYEMAVADDATGGYLIPPDQQTTILKIAEQQSVLFGRVTKFPVRGNSLSIPYMNITSLASGGISGGVVMYWEAEAATATASSFAFGKIEMHLQKLFGVTTATGEFVEDSPIGASAFARDGFARGLAWTLDNAILRGTGTGQPKGILSDAALVSVTRNTSSQINYVDLVNMLARAYAPVRAGGFWIYNQDAEPQIRQLTIPVGTGGSWVQAFQIGPDGNGNILGYPAYACEHCTTMGTVGDILFVNPANYVMINKGPRFAESMHIYFLSDREAYRMIYRTDGQGWWPSTLTPSQGSNTLSWCVALAT